MSTLAKALWIGAGVAAVLGGSVIAIGYSSGPGSCTYPNTASMGTSQAGTGGFVIDVTREGESVTSYTPGATYTVTLSAPDTYRGFLLQSVAGAPGAPDQSGVGEFVNLGAQYENGPCGVAASSVGHNLSRRNAPAASDTFEWVAPPEGTGDVTFHAVGVYSRFVWHGQETLITTTLSEGGIVDTDDESWTTLKTRYES